MFWSHAAAYFFAGALLANFFSHFVSGVQGREFPTPFASPPFRGQSSPGVNVLYGLCNLAVAYALLLNVGDFEPRSLWQAGAVGFGVTAMSLLTVRSLARLQSAGLRQRDLTTGEDGLPPPEKSSGSVSSPGG